MVQSILFFILGFLAATLIALAVAPPLWRRAVRLTRRRLEASLPLSLNEMQAEADRARAEGAMTIRRLEVDAKALKEKLTTQAVELSRLREEVQRINGHSAAQTSALAGFEGRVPELERALRSRDEQIEALSQRLAAAEAAGEQRANELDRLDQDLEEASFASSSRKIELAGRDSEIERLSTDLSRLRSEHREVERRVVDVMAEKDAIEESLTVERMRSADLRKRLEAAEAPAPPTAAPDGPTGEARLAGASPDELVQRADGEVGGALERLAAERDRLESRLTTITRENKRLRAAARNEPASGDANGVGGPAADAALREQIQKLAAEMVSLTAMLEGPDSPVDKALSKPAAGGFGSVEQAGQSLADRVRALQKAAGRR